MKGFDLARLPKTIPTFDPSLPDLVATVERIEERIAPCRDVFENRYGKGFSLPEKIHNLKPQGLLKLGFEPLEIMRLCLANCWCKTDEMEAYLKKDYFLGLLYSIETSFWRWGPRGCRQGGVALWNELAAAWAGLHRFNLGVPGLEVRLDHARYANPKGVGRCSLTYVDTPLVFLVHERGEHVMTLGFAFNGKRQLLLGQIQLVRKKGNRFLYRFPKPYVEHVIDCFAAAWPDFELCLVDGEAQTKRYREEFTKASKEAQESCEGNHRDLRRAKDQEEFDRCLRWLAMSLNNMLYWRRKLRHFDAGDGERIARLYDQPLEGWTRMSQATVHGFDTPYVPLQPRRDSARAAQAA